MTSHHVRERAQQRGIPPLVDELLDRYGREQHDGRGCVVVYLDKRSIRAMERDLGRRPVALLSTYRNCYKVRSCEDGRTITTGHRFKRIPRS